jgi:pimeloyl-ACP methyl ester carboxylesterase
VSSEIELPLVEAAVRVGITIADRREPVDRTVQAGVKLHYLDWGSEDKPWMLCIHGSAQNAHMWDFTALAFCDRYHIVAIDQRGHGDSEWAPDADYGRDAYVDDITQAVDRLGMSSVVLMGLSLGGSNSVAYAAANPDRVSAMVVVDVGPETAGRGEQSVNSFVTQPDVLDSFDEFVQRVMEYSPHRPEWQVRSSLGHSLRELPDGRLTWKYDPVLRDPARRADRLTTTPDSASRWALWERVACPTLIVRGEHSNMLSREVAERMVGWNPNSRLIEVPKAGHRVPGDNPVAFEGAVRAFLDGLDQ